MSCVGYPGKMHYALVSDLKCLALDREHDRLHMMEIHVRTSERLSGLWIEALSLDARLIRKMRVMRHPCLSQAMA